MAAAATMAIAALGGCSPAERTVSEETPAAATQTIADLNVLSGDEQAAGWRLLFNGQDLTGWRGYKKDAPPTGWVAQDGTLTLDAAGGGDIITTEEFGAFELALDWKIAEGGNSGIMYFVQELPDAPRPYFTGPEMQVLDDERHPDRADPSHRAGALYDLVAPTANVVKPAGTWNSARIVAANGRIEHWLNGVKIVETSYGDEAWKAMVAGSKFKQWADFGVASSGHIALQDHGDRVWYRNIKVRPL
jgi:hypothetical protein